MLAALNLCLPPHRLWRNIDGWPAVEQKRRYDEQADSRANPPVPSLHRDNHGKSLQAPPLQATPTTTPLFV